MRVKGKTARGPRMGRKVMGRERDWGGGRTEKEAEEEEEEEGERGGKM